MSEKLEISTLSIVKVIAVVLGIVLVYYILDILALLFVAFIIAASMSYPTNWLVKNKIPRLLAVIISYVVLFIIVALLIWMVIPPLAGELSNLSSTLPDYITKLQSSVNWLQNAIIPTDLISNTEILKNISSRLSLFSNNIFSTIGSIFGGIISFLVVMVISIYLTLQQHGLKKALLAIIPMTHQVYAGNLIDRIEKRVGGWVAGQLLLALIIGTMTYIGLTLLGVKYALALAVMSGILEIVPYIGPIISAIIAAGLAIIQSPILAIWVLVLFFIIQQSENHLIVPLVMSRTVGLNPLTVIIAILIGEKLAGLFGILISVPAAAILLEFVRDYKTAK